jgi:hypothetical protein
LSNKDDINLKVIKIKKSKKSFLSLIASAIAAAVSAPDAQSIDYIPPPDRGGPILVPAPIAPPRDPFIDPAEPVYQDPSLTY